MYAHKHIYILYGIIMAGVALLAGCSHDDAAEAALEADASATPQARTAITFECAKDGTYRTYGTYNSPKGAEEPEGPLTRSVYGHEGLMDNAELYYTGFGVFASTAPDTPPDFMYNQEVSYELVGDMENPLKGYWSYYPIKYWPNSPEGIDNFTICAYAPYVTPPGADDGTTTGIIGISSNTSSTPYVEFRRASRAQDVVDLLWWYYAPATKKIETLQVSMSHALARVAVNIKADAELLPSGTKLLVKRITLSSTKEAPASQTGIAQTGKLVLNDKTDGLGSEVYPVWQNQDKVTASIVIDKDALSTSYYGAVDEQVRYLDDLPYAWQPEGVTTTAKNALTTIDRKAFIYLIPQESLTLSCDVLLQKMTTTTSEEVRHTVSNIALTPLRGNTTYTLELRIKSE